MKVCLVEDNENDAFLIQRVILKVDSSAEIFVTDNKNGFFKIIRDQDLDMIISDYKLPSFSGFEAWKIVCEEELGLPFVFISGAVSKDIAKDTVLNEASAFVLKDDLAQLEVEVRKVLATLKEETQKVESKQDIKQRNKELLRRLNEHLDAS